MVAYEMLTFVAKFKIAFGLLAGTRIMPLKSLPVYRVHTKPFQRPTKFQNFKHEIKRTREALRWIGLDWIG